MYFRKYCFGDKAIPFDIVSDQAVNFPGTGQCPTLASHICIPCVYIDTHVHVNVSARVHALLSLLSLSAGTANYKDPNVSMSLPIFTIHGNHDAPYGTYSPL